MKNLTGKINDLISFVLLTPYYWYCNVKELPRLVEKIKIHKPTNKEFLIQYRAWLIRKARDAAAKQKSLNKEDWLPRFSILLIGENPKNKCFQKSLEAIENINYPKFEILISLSNAGDLKSHKTIQSSSTNEAERFNELAQIADSDYMLFVREGDILESHIFTILSKEIIGYPSIDLLYFDEGKVNSNDLKLAPNFKPNWSPDLLLGKNYINNGFILRTSLFESVGEFNTEIKNAYKYDLFLKAAEITKKISHISGVLYHQHTSNQNVDSLIDEKQALENAIKRREIKGELSVSDKRKRNFIINYHPSDLPKVSIIIPSRDQANILNICLKSIKEKTSYDNYEIIIIDNGSSEDSFFEAIDNWRIEFGDKLIVTKLDIPFNFSKLNNEAANIATGEYLLFLNNDVEIISKNWITAMVGQAQNKQTGAVGAKLLFPNDKIQHAGILLGVGGVASHPFSKAERDHDHDFVNTSVNYSALTGACLLLSKESFLEVGGFDEDYVVEFNDIDLCLKLKKKGLHNIYLPQVELYHYESYSRGRKHKNLPSFLRYRKERQRFVNQWGDYIKNDPSYNKYLNKDLDQLFEPDLD